MNQTLARNLTKEVVVPSAVGVNLDFPILGSSRVLVETRAWCIINKTLGGSLINNRLICKGINLNTSRHGGLRSVWETSSTETLEEPNFGK